MSLLSFNSIRKSFGDKPVLSGLDLSVEEGEFSVLFGASASGKSVLLRMLVGLDTPDQGSILLRGVDALALKPGARQLGYVPQSFALFPNKSVRDNIAYPLTLAHTPAPAVNEAVMRTAELLDIAPLLERRPEQLSGGQKQRVAIARGLVRSTELYVLDDPLVGLDFKLRERLIDDLRTTREALGATFLYATSDPSEALALGSTVAVLAGGRIVEHAPPYELYNNPQRVETMSSVCFPSGNRLRGVLRTAGRGVLFSTEWGDVPVTLDAAQGTAGDEHDEVVAVVRPEHVGFSATGDAALRGTAAVALREDLGAEELMHLGTDATRLVAVARAGATDFGQADLGDLVEFWISYQHVVLFRDGVRIGSGARDASTTTEGADR